jgi:hypothetical protein
MAGRKRKVQKDEIEWVKIEFTGSQADADFLEMQFDTQKIDAIVETVDAASGLTSRLGMVPNLMAKITVRVPQEQEEMAQAVVDKYVEARKKNRGKDAEEE